MSAIDRDKRARAARIYKNKYKVVASSLYNIVGLSALLTFLVFGLFQDMHTLQEYLDFVKANWIPISPWFYVIAIPSTLHFLLKNIARILIVLNIFYGDKV